MTGLIAWVAVICDYKEEVIHGTGGYMHKIRIAWESCTSPVNSGIHCVPMVSHW